MVLRWAGDLYIPVAGGLLPGVCAVYVSGCARVEAESWAEEVWYDLPTGSSDVGESRRRVRESGRRVRESDRPNPAADEAGRGV